MKKNIYMYIVYIIICIWWFCYFSVNFMELYRCVYIFLKIHSFSIEYHWIVMNCHIFVVSVPMILLYFVWNVCIHFVLISYVLMVIFNFSMNLLHFEWKCIHFVYVFIYMYIYIYIFDDVWWFCIDLFTFGMQIHIIYSIFIYLYVCC
jgi:hypothetical protein